MRVPQLLIVDDEDPFRMGLEQYFANNGFHVASTGDGSEALRLLDSKPDVVILDVELGSPTLDGLEVCREIRRRFGYGVGVIMISGVRKDEMEQIIGREVGADDYLLKPFTTRLLLAAVKGLLRRLEGDGPGNEEWYVVDGYLRIHRRRPLVQAGGKKTDLTAQEYCVLIYLYTRYGQICLRADLIDNCWPGCPEGVSPQAVDSCISDLRSKIEPPEARHPNWRYLHTKYGLGHYFLVRESEA